MYRPQLARLVKAPPEGDEWLHEMKYDGYRIGCRIRKKRVTLISRNGKDWTASFPEIAAEALKLGADDALIDGELSIVLPDGRTSFQALQNAASGSSRRALVYFAFDALRLGGENLQRMPLEERKQALLRLVGKTNAKATIRYSEHVAGRGAEVFAEACRLQLEGIVSKRRDAIYTPGRGDTWLKTKCVLRQEFVIGGFTDPEGSRQGIGALLVGYHDDSGALRFSGKVGTGFSARVADDLRRRLDRLERRDSPFQPPPTGSVARRAHWVAPKLVAEVVFTEWTKEGKIRHPSFQGLSADKPARAVSREIAAEPPRVPRRLGAPRKARAAKTATASTVAAPSKSRKPTVAGIPISNPDRVIYPDVGITKLDVAQYFARMADWILPHLRSRPLTLVRCPEGIRGGCFYMKHSKVWAPPAIRRVKIQEKTKVGDYLVVDTTPALVGLAQMGILEIHTWNTRIERVEHPDRLVLDLDPGAKVAWARVIEGARLVRRLLDRVGLDSFVKTTGGRGLHVVVPLAPSADWKDCLEFTRAAAAAMERTDPERYTTNFAKAGRERKILVDYLRNNRTNTSVTAYSTRARPGAAVSTPLKWTELEPSLDPAVFTLLTIEKRLARLKSDPGQEYWQTRQTLPARRRWEFGI